MVLAKRPELQSEIVAITKIAMDIPDMLDLASEIEEKLKTAILEFKKSLPKACLNNTCVRLPCFLGWFKKTVDGEPVK